MSFDKLFDGGDAHLLMTCPACGRQSMPDDVHTCTQSTHSPDASIKAPEIDMSEREAFEAWWRPYYLRDMCRPGVVASDAFIAGLREARAQVGQVERQAVPEGFVLVPIEPTEKMIMAGGGWTGTAAGYRAMIAAAPTPESAK